MGFHNRGDGNLPKLRSWYAPGVDSMKRVRKDLDAIVKRAGVRIVKAEHVSIAAMVFAALTACSSPVEPEIVVRSIFLTDTVYVNIEGDPFERVASVRLNHDPGTGLSQVIGAIAIRQRVEGEFIEVRAHFKIFDSVTSTADDRTTVTEILALVSGPM